MGLRAGTLHKRVTVQSRSIATDVMGGQLTTWTDLKVIWAEMRALSGKELELAKTIATDVTHEINCRYDAIFADPRIAATYRLLYNGRKFNILGVQNEDERNHMITMQASEGPSDG